MSFRTRLVLAFAALAVLPLGAFALGMRGEVGERLAASYERRGEALLATLERDLDRQAETIATRLRELAGAVADDNRLRLAIVRDDPGQRPYLIDWAGRAAGLTGLSVLQLQDERGRILSSGHFRAEFDRLDPALPAALFALGGAAALAEVRTPAGPRLALLRGEQLAVGGRSVTLVGGSFVDGGSLERLGRDAGLEVGMRWPGGEAGRVPIGDAAPGTPARELRLPFVGPEPGEAALFVSWSLEPLREARRGVDRWFLIALALAAASALALAGWLARRLSRPLTELARRTASLDLDRLDVDFRTDRSDEIGTLARLLAALTDRLRASAARLREAERRATLGEVARQVNHDIRNGLVPIRNVFLHLLEVAGRAPAEVPAVLAERKGTIESGIAYLEQLATSYARLSPALDLRPCDPNRVAREVAAASGARLAGERPASAGRDARAPVPGDVRLRLELAEGLPAVRADPLALRRILGNLVGNALDSVREGGGEVRLSTSETPDAGATPTPAGGGRRVRFTVSDTGPGLAPEEQQRIFQDFYTTRPGGTGLGLSVVRRLVADLGGSLRVESRPGEGARFIVELDADGESG